MLINAMHVLFCVWGFLSLTTTIIKRACKLQAEMKAHLCQLWVSKHLPLSVWGRWKYLVHDMGLLNTASQWKGAQPLSSWNLKGHFFFISKRQMSKVMQAKKKVLLYSKEVRHSKKRSCDDWKSKSKYSLLYSLFQVKEPSDKNSVLQTFRICSLKLFSAD